MKLLMCLFRLLGAIWFGATMASGQSVDIAQRVYNSTQDSVFLVYLNDSSGSPTALGTAFLVAPRLLITNAHVADAGSPVLAVGPVRLPLKVIRKDEENDLAILSVDVDLTSKPLTLASGKVSPGEQIFAIGNPEGLEKTISQGIVAGLRKTSDHDLIQITSPISHGSSGGPVMNSKGEVVGVAVGMLEDGQNLNFAVPIAYVRSLLDNRTEVAAANNLGESLDEAIKLVQKRSQEDYSADPDSDYQKQGKKLLQLIERLSEQSIDEATLEEVACIGTTDSSFSDIGIGAAQKLNKKNPSPHNRELLAYALYDRAQNELATAAFAKDGSNEKSEANAAYKRYLSEASVEASNILTQNKHQDLLVARFVLGKSKEEQSQYGDAIELLTPVANENSKICTFDLTKQAYLTLIRSSNESKKPDEAESWFRKYAAIYEPTPYEWDSEGDRRSDAQDFKNSADAYEKAASQSTYYDYDFCYAAVANYVRVPENGDGVLDDGRKCIDSSVKDTSESNQHHFKHELPFVYHHMAAVLKERGVDKPALEYIKESLASKPDDPFSLSTEADILDDLQRYSECIAAAQAAISASDGKYPWMHFRLGSCYFSTENWSMAAASFERAADADKTDAISAFNAGLSLSRQGYGADAKIWYSEALRRKPDDALRAKILSALE